MSYMVCREVDERSHEEVTQVIGFPEPPVPPANSCSTSPHTNITAFQRRNDLELACSLEAFQGIDVAYGTGTNCIAISQESPSSIH